MTQSVIRDLHSILLVEPYEVEARTPSGEKTTKRVAIGTYKTTPNHVRTVTDKLHRYASPEETPARMSDLMDWYRTAETDGDLHPLAIATLFHHEFTAIHPFDDGNGRMARILTNLMVMRQGYPPLVVKQEHKENYFYALAAADEGDVTELLAFLGDALTESMQLYLRGARGESIDELSGFDKRLALLEQSLTTKESEAEQTKTRDAQVKVFSEFIKPLLTKLHRRYEKIDRLFSRSVKPDSLYVTPNGGKGIAASTRPDTIHKLAVIFENEDVLQVRLFETWEGLRNDVSKRLYVVQEFNLGKTDFAAEIGESRFTGVYGKPVFEEQVTAFASRVLKNIFERLESLSSSRGRQ